MILLRALWMVSTLWNLILVVATKLVPALPRSVWAALAALTKKECIVCGTMKNLPKAAPTPACSHPSQVCAGCLRQTCLSSIRSGSYYTTGILCPSLNCRKSLDYHDIKKFATPEDFNKYDKLLLYDLLRADKRYVQCLNPDCGAWQEHTGDTNVVECYSCGTEQCFQHRMLWDEESTGSESDERPDLTQDVSVEWVYANTKPCPQCTRVVIKEEGCDHLICNPPGGCGHQFCWKCLASWFDISAGGTAEHYDHCDHYTGIRGGNPAPGRIASTNRRPFQYENQDESASWRDYLRPSLGPFYRSGPTRSFFEYSGPPVSHLGVQTRVLLGQLRQAELRQRGQYDQ